MAVAWTTISNAEVAAGAPVTTALMTALRDNPEGIAQRAAGAPKIFGVPYDFQEFTANGTWNKPSNAESGDRVIVHCVGGGGAGARAAISSISNSNAGAGAGGIFKKFNDIDDLPASVGITVGAGGVPTSGNGGGGGTSNFGVNPGDPNNAALLYFMHAGGGGGGLANSTSRALQGLAWMLRDYGTDVSWGYSEWTGGNGASPRNGAATLAPGSGWSAAGGGGSSELAYNQDPYPIAGGYSALAGNGGEGTDYNTAFPIGNYLIDGEFPGGGGGLVDTSATGNTVGGAGADGVVRVWCMKEG